MTKGFALPLSPTHSQNLESMRIVILNSTKCLIVEVQILIYRGVLSSFLSISGKKRTKETPLKEERVYAVKRLRVFDLAPTSSPP